MGYLELAVGNPGTGKSYFTRRLLRDQIRPGALAIYHSSNEDDRFEFGPAMSLRELERATKVPRAFQLVHCTGLEVLRAVNRALDLWIVTLFADEFHELAPNLNQPFSDPYDADERRELRTWARDFMRKGRHGRLNLYGASPTIAGIHPEAWRFARTTHYFRQSEPSDLAALEERYGARAALEVARLRDQEHVTVTKTALPRGWEGHLARLEAKARRLGT